MSATDFPPAFPQWVAAVVGALVMASLCLYGFLFQSAWRGGKVRVANFGLPDLMAGTVLFTWFLGLSIRSFTSDPRPVTRQDLIGGGILYALFALGICGFFVLRKIRLADVFGLDRVAFWKVPIWAVGLLLGVLPVLNAAGAIAQKLLGPDAQPQEVVKFFQQAAQDGDSLSIWIALLIGGILAPIAEELMFRGYLYPLLKRYLGLIAGLVMNSVLFAAMHSNLPSLPALALLAVALTLAYELSGSLLIPITMHSFFNLTMFSVMLKAASR